MKILTQFLSLIAVLIYCRTASAHGGISAAGEIGMFFLITFLAWIASSFYVGKNLVRITGNKIFILLSPLIAIFIPLSVLLIGIMIGIIISQFESSGSKAENLGIILSFVVHLLVCGSIISENKIEKIREFTSLIMLPMVVLSFVWLKVFVF